MPGTMENLRISREKDRQTDRHTHTHTQSNNTAGGVLLGEGSSADSEQGSSRRKGGPVQVGNPRRLHGGSEISPSGLQALVQIHCKTKKHTLKVWGGVGIQRAPCGQRTTGKEWQQVSPGLACEGPLTGSHP